MCGQINECGVCGEPVVFTGVQVTLLFTTVTCACGESYQLIKELDKPLNDTI